MCSGVSEHKFTTIHSINFPTLLFEQLVDHSDTQPI